MSRRFPWLKLRKKTDPERMPIEERGRRRRTDPTLGCLV